MSGQKRIRARRLVECGREFFPVKGLRERPNCDALLMEAQETLLSQLKDVLGGLGPIFGKDQLLGACASIIDEDFDADGPQTPLPFRDGEDDYKAWRAKFEQSRAATG